MNLGWVLTCDACGKRYLKPHPSQMKGRGIPRCACGSADLLLSLASARYAHVFIEADWERTARINAAREKVDAS
jgi:hypothetical protein